MSDKPGSFLDLAIKGEVMADEIDDYVDVWHESDEDIDLHVYLGMTSEEYALWVADPSYLGIIIAARAHQRPLAEAVNDNYADLSKLAARSDQTNRMAKLKAWLEAQEQRGI